MMYPNRKFEKEARKRRIMALYLAIAFHLVAFAAILYLSGDSQFLQDFLQNWFFTSPKEGAEVLRP